MSIKYVPDKYLKKVASRKNIKGMLNRRNVDLKKTALSFVNEFDFIDKGEIAETALKVVNNYEKRIDAGEITKEEVLKDPKLLYQRIQGQVLYQISQSIRKEYAGFSFTWLPSESEEPDPEHQLKYGKTFVIEDGVEIPNERYGCKCGMEIHTKETELDI